MLPGVVFWGDVFFSPSELFTGQHILFSSLLQTLAFNRAKIWEAPVGFELWILEKKWCICISGFRGLCTFSLLPEGRGPEGTESSEHRDCPRTGNKTLSWLCCKPSQGDIHPVSCRAVFSLTWFLRKSIIFSLSLSPFSNSFFRSSFSWILVVNLIDKCIYF